MCSADNQKLRLSFSTSTRSGKFVDHDAVAFPFLRAINSRGIDKEALCLDNIFLPRLTRTTAIPTM
jgi:hypothetical protein